MNVLIVYATMEGQTRKIAERTKARVHERGEAELRDSLSLASSSSLEPFQTFIIAASVHQKLHQETIVDFVIAHRELLNAGPSAFISVSLSAALEEERTDAQGYVDSFVSMTGWQPRRTLLLGGALRFIDYDYFQEQIVKFIVMNRGTTWNAERDHEFTDWNALDDFVDAFIEAAL